MARGCLADLPSERQVCLLKSSGVGLTRVKEESASASRCPAVTRMWHSPGWEGRHWPERSEAALSLNHQSSFSRSPTSAARSRAAAIAVPAVPKSLPDLVFHINDLRARAGQPQAAVNDHLTGLLRYSKADVIPFRREPRELRHSVGLRRCQGFRRRSSPKRCYGR
jgi:hypothetical protein